MIKKIRLRYIIATISTIILITVGFLIGFNYLNNSFVSNSADHVLNALMANESSYSSITPTETFQSFDSENNKYFIIKFSNTNQVISIRMFDILISDEATNMAKTVLNKGKSGKGFYNDYRYIISSDRKTLIFLDCKENIKRASDFKISSILIGIIIATLLSIIAITYSKRAVNPIVKAYQKQKEFITDASHELKTPLSIILANNELIELEKGENDSTEVIKKQVGRMTSLIKNMTNLASIDETLQKAQFAKFNLSNSLRDVADNFVEAFRNDGKELIINIEDNIHYNGNESLIRQLLSILLDNSKKYSLTVTKVDLSINKNKKKHNISLVVKNDARDVKEGIQEEVFNRFYRGAGSRNVEGNGIGLSIAKETVEQHKGMITAFGNVVDSSFEINIIL